MPWPVDHGPDIAHYQEITGSPVSPAWRLFSHKMSEGAVSGDATFPARWDWMRQQGFRYRGAYHWLRSDSAISAQVKNVVGRLSREGGLLKGEFIQSDWETTPGIVVNSAVQEREFCDRLEQYYGRACTITYSSDWIPDSPEDPDTLSEFYNWLNMTQGEAPLWYANYNSNPLNPAGGQQECKRYGADVWQFTSSFRHPSIVSKSGGGFDMNHVLNWSTLDLIAGYDEQPPPQEEETMKAILYTVTSDGASAGFYVSPERTVAQVRNGFEWQIWVEAGALEKPAESVGHFIEQITTWQPLGALGTQGKAVLGPDATAEWNRRAVLNVTVSVPPVQSTKFGMAGTVDLNAGTVDLNPK
jgi:hypothetical protein